MVRRFWTKSQGRSPTLQCAPERYPIVDESIRQAVLRRFPYLILFHSADEEVVVISCFHTIGLGPTASAQSCGGEVTPKRFGDYVCKSSCYAGTMR